MLFVGFLLGLAVRMYTFLHRSSSSSTSRISTTTSSTSTSSTTRTTTTTTSTTTSTTTTSGTTSTTRSTSTSTTTSSTTTTTTAFAEGWNSTGITVAGIAGSAGDTASRLDTPVAVDLDAAGALYIADWGNHRIEKWLPNASTGTTIAGLANGTASTGSNGFRYPGGIALANGDFYVGDALNYRVQRWSNGASTGTTVAGVTGVPGSTTSLLNYSRTVTFDATSNQLYVADFNNHRVLSFPSGSLSGTVVAGGNGQGTNNNQLCQPFGLYLNSSTNSLLIANYCGHNVVRWVLGASSWTIVAGSPSGISGASSTLLNGPAAITLDSMNNLYVADMHNHRIQFFMVGETTATTIAGTTGMAGLSPNLLSSPYGLAVDNQFTLYVVDTNNHRVIKYERY